jgi:hypothetical protein
MGWCDPVGASPRAQVPPASRLASRSGANATCTPRHGRTKLAGTRQQAAGESPAIGRVVVRRIAAAGSRPKPTGCRDRQAAVLEAIRRVDRTPPGSESGACRHRGDAGTGERPGAPGGQIRRRSAAQRGKDSRRGKAAPALHTSLGRPRDTKPEARPQGIGAGEGAPNAPEVGQWQSARRRVPMQVGHRRPQSPTRGKATPGITTSGGT